MMPFKTAASAAALLVFAGAASAAGLSGTGGATSDAAVAGGTTIGFDDAGDFGNYLVYSDSGVNFSSNLDVGGDFNGQYNTLGGGSLFTGFDLDPDQIDILFDSSVTAFAFNWGASDNNWDMNVYDAFDNLIGTQTMGATFTSNAGDYFGWEDAGGISRVSLVDRLNRIASGDYVFIDDFTFVSGGGGGVSAVPLPAGLPLLLTGFGLFGLVRARRNKA